MMCQPQFMMHMILRLYSVRRDLALLAESAAFEPGRTIQVTAESGHVLYISV